MSDQLSFREIRYKEKRDKILKNAARLVAKKGYENVSLVEIAAKLKLNKATLYYYFKSKDEIFFVIQMQAIEQATTGVNGPENAVLVQEMVQGQQDPGVRAWHGSGQSGYACRYADKNWTDPLGS